MPHSLRYAANLSMLFKELPLLERPAAARDAGFGAVEFWWPFGEAVPGDRAVEEFVRALSDAGVSLTGLNFFAGDMPAGDRGLVSWPGREAEFADSVAVAIGIAERTGCRTFNALYGNRIDGVEHRALALSNLDFAAKAASTIDATLVIEPLSGADRYPIRTAAEAIALIDEAGQDNIELLADLYHLAVNGDDLGALPGLVDRIGHVQIADAPGRGEPGTGELDIEGHLGALEAAGYRGFVGLEYTPTADPFGWLPRERRGIA